jgi:hypothetical protein
MRSCEPLAQSPPRGLPIISYPRLLIQHIRSYPPYLEAVSSIRNPRTRHVVVSDNLMGRGHALRPTRTCEDNIELILWKWVGKVFTGCVWLRTGPVAGCCEQLLHGVW